MQEREKKRVSRRSFVAATSAAIAAPYIIPASALGKEGNVAPSERIVMGVIGTGGQARGLTGNAINQPDTHVVALCDVNAKNLEKAKKQVDEFYDNKDCQTYHDFRELNARGDIDAIIIGTPDHWHALTSIDAAKHGKDIYCEKPLTWSLGEGQAVVKAVRDNKRVFQVGSMQRSDGRFKRACELVRNGYLGKVKHINVSLPDYGNHIWVDMFPKAPDHLDWEFYVGPATWTPFHPKRYDWDWRWWMAFGGGQMMDWIGHHGDIAHMAMDWDNTGPREVKGIRWEPVKERNNLYDAPARYRFECEYKRGITMTVANASDMPEEFKQAAGDRLGTQFIAKDGEWLYVDRGEFKASNDELIKLRLKDNDFRFRRERNHMRDFLDCIKSRKDPIAPVNAGHRSASIGHLGKIACTLGASFKWDPETETFPKEPSLNGLLTRKYRGDWTLE
ncbi:MAG: Gfo/Idh/MocA family oxidoreductase [Candidatus Hydrogenedentota bacterium]